MTDLVMRLRELAPEYDIDKVMVEAADEIERLRAALDACADYGDKQVAEIERLRAQVAELEWKWRETQRILR